MAPEKEEQRMKKLLRMICLTLALCMLAGCGAGGAQPTPSGAFRQTGETGEPASWRRQTIPPIPSGPAWRTTPTAKGAWTWTHMTRP